MSSENFSNGRPRPNVCRKLNFDDDLESENLPGTTTSDNGLRYSDAIKRILMNDALIKSDFYNFDFVNNRPLPSKESGYEWSYKPIDCRFWFRPPYMKGDSLNPTDYAMNSVDDNSLIIKPEDNLKDLRTPAKRNPKTTEIVEPDVRPHVDDEGETES